MSVDDFGIEVLKKAAVEITPGDKSEYRLRVEGTSTFSGLSQAMRVTTLEVTDTAVALPATALTDRNSIVIDNLSEIENLYISTDAGLTADTVIGTTSGKKIPADSDWKADVKGTIVIYGRAETGKTVLVQVVELA